MADFYNRMNWAASGGQPPAMATPMQAYGPTPAPATPMGAGGMTSGFGAMPKNPYAAQGPAKQPPAQPRVNTNVGVAAGMGGYGPDLPIHRVDGNTFGVDTKLGPLQPNTNIGVGGNYGNPFGIGVAVHPFWGQMFNQQPREPDYVRGFPTLAQVPGLRGPMPPVTVGSSGSFGALTPAGGPGMPVAEQARRVAGGFGR